MRYKSKHLLWISGITLLSLSCNKSWEDYFNPDGLADHVYRGPVQKIGNGQIRSFFSVSPAGVPLKIGFEMSDAALENLSQDATDFSSNTFVLSLPQKAKDLTAFNHLVADWNPAGHEPEAIYGLPHFDFHFYKISLTAQEAIPPYTPETTAMFDKEPPAGYLPATFMASPGGVPEMGKHWIDVNAPEFNGNTFTKTFIYGTFNGEVTFYEPMITRAFLLTNSNTSTAVDQPTKFAPGDRYYPTKYETTWDAKKKVRTVALTDFVWRASVN